MSLPVPRDGLAVALLALCLVAPAARAAEPPRLPREVEAAFRGIDEAADRLGRARAALAALEAGERPRGSAATWGGVVERGQASAAAVHRLELPAIPDAADFTVAPESLRSCAARPAGLARIERLARTLAAEGQRLGELRAFLRERQAQAQRAEEARRALVEAPRAQLDQARLEEHFSWAWDELERPLAAALAGLQADLRRWLERVERGQAEVRARAATLDGLAAEWGRARDCALAGRWAGARTVDGATSGLALRLAPEGEGWSGTISVGGADLQVKSASLKGDAAEVSAAGGRAWLTGTLSRDERTLTGRISTPEDGPGRFTLRRQ